MKKRTVYLLFLTAATIAAVCYGSLKYLGKPVFEISKDSFALDFRKSERTTVHKDTGSFDSIQMSLSNARIQLCSGESYAVTYTGPKEYCPSFSVKDGILTAAEPSGKKSISFYGTNDPVIKITIPEGTEKLSDVSISSDNGDISARPDKSLTFDSLKLTSSNGSISVLRCSGSTLSAYTDNGDVKASGIVFNNSKIETDNGSLSVIPGDDLKEYTISAKTDSGTITIGKVRYTDDEPSVKSGNGSKKLTLYSDSGDISVSGVR
ncbi:MAG: DUF4097 family beta strand repeat-containing protein [Candidatus Weimeria sp.]